MARSLDIIDPKKDIQKEPEEPILDDEKNSSGGSFYLVIGIIALIIAASAAVYIYTTKAPAEDKNHSSNDEGVAVVSEEKEEEVQTPEAEVSETAQVIATPFAYQGESIRIANGNSISGEASRIKSILENDGFEIESIGNATRGYNESIIYYKTGQEDLAKALKQKIAGEYEATIELADNIVASYDAVIVLGSK